ncbi:hypothetical protein [Deinococcus altitudinis]|uniref:hypothetical protein n=1 Tax=Deinococcus altitudinis TaxID=468914 RepID=UPI00389227AD
MTKNTEDQSNTAETPPRPSGFQPEVPQDSDTPEEQKKTAASGTPNEDSEAGRHGRPEDDEDDGHS